jgi:hypothetical protein
MRILIIDELDENIIETQNYFIFLREGKKKNYWGFFFKEYIFLNDY